MNVWRVKFSRNFYNWILNFFIFNSFPIPVFSDKDKKIKRLSELTADYMKHQQEYTWIQDSLRINKDEHEILENEITNAEKNIDISSGNFEVEVNITLDDEIDFE